jgi:SAM-dependent methyltransferase
MSGDTRSPASKDQVAACYEQHHDASKYEFLFGDPARRDLLVRLIGRGQKVLDIGCRAGNLTRYYHDGNDVVGVDVDRNALDLFRAELGLPTHWVDLDSEPLPCADASFDVVVFTEVMEHLRFPDRALAEIARVLAPQGRLIGSVPNAFRLRNRLRFLAGKHFEDDPTHLRWYSVTTLRNTLADRFVDIEVHPVSGHLLGGGRTGLPVFGWLPHRIHALFCLDLVFTARKAGTA